MVALSVVLQIRARRLPAVGAAAAATRPSSRAAGTFRITWSAACTPVTAADTTAQVLPVSDGGSKLAEPTRVPPLPSGAARSAELSEPSWTLAPVTELGPR